jgi:hypothetical protein
MASRDPDELETELESIEFTGDRELLSELRSEARETVDAQLTTLNDIDTKASKILRLNLVLIGILVSVASLVVQNGTGNGKTSAEPFLNLYIISGIGALLLSTAFAAMTYTASELDVGLSSENLERLLDADFPRDEVETLLVKNYIVRINFNRSTNIRNIPLIQTTIVLVVGAVVLFTLGVYEAITGSVPLWLLVPAVLLLLAVIVVSGLPVQTKRAVRDIREWE